MSGSEDFARTWPLLLEAVAALHQHGYQRLRVLSGMAPSGGYWRFSLTDAANLDLSGRYPRLRDPWACASYNSGAGARVGDLVVEPSTTPQQLAEHLLAMLGDGLVAESDPAYVAWFRRMADVAIAAGKPLVAFADSGFTAGEWRIGWGGPNFGAPPAFAPGEQESTHDEGSTTMTKHESLGRLKPVPVRDVWPHEAHDFTQWLLQNADVLSDVLGMDLELTAAEHAVGGYWLDLIGRDLGTGDVVIVENQLETTDHGHLGQLLTYAAGTEAVNVVWCAPRFRDEHRAALDWLNERTDERTRFFGIEVGAVQIDDSRAAPHFRLVVEPNDWAKQVHAETAATTLSPKQKAYQEFWAAVYERIHAEQPTWTSSTKAPAQAWITLPFGTSKIWFGMAYTKQGLCVELYFGSASAEENKAEFAKYEAIKDQIEADFGDALSFQELPEKVASRIAVYRPGADVLDENTAEYVDWFMSTFAAFRTAMIKARAAVAG